MREPPKTCIRKEV